MNKQSCDLCDEFSGGRNNAFIFTYTPELNSRNVLVTKNFRVLPSLGQIVEGHLMIVPTAHYVAVGDLPLNLAVELQNLTTQVRKALLETYGNCVFFEHGARDHQAGGCGIYHAHLHAVPLGDRSDPFEELGSLHRFVEILTFGDLKLMSSGQPYLYYEGVDLRRYVAHVTHLPSQYMRQILAKSVGNSNWNWRTAGKEASFRSALLRLSNWFAGREGGDSDSRQVDH